MRRSFPSAELATIGPRTLAAPSRAITAAFALDPSSSFSMNASMRSR